jgi:hypothetical protein
VAILEGIARLNIGEGTVQSKDSSWVTAETGTVVVLVGIVAILVCFGLALYRYGDSAQNVVAVLGAVTGIIGSLVGAFFGLQTGAKAATTAAANAEIGRRDATRAAIAMAAATDPAKAAQVVRDLGLSQA